MCYNMTWEEYTGSRFYMESSYSLLIGYLDYCREKKCNPVDREKIMERLLFIKSQIDKAIKQVIADRLKDGSEFK